MNDVRIQIWNWLHDGEIASVSPELHGSVRIFVAIPYLRRKFEPLGASFELSLSGVSLLEFRHFDGEVTSLAQALEIGGPEILSSSSEAMPIVVETTMGQLKIDFQSISLMLDTGQPIELVALQRAAEEYWAAFRARTNEVSG